MPGIDQVLAQEQFTCFGGQGGSTPAGPNIVLSFPKSWSSLLIDLSIFIKQSKDLGKEIPNQARSSFS